MPHSLCRIHCHCHVVKARRIYRDLERTSSFPNKLLSPTKHTAPRVIKSPPLLLPRSLCIYEPEIATFVVLLSVGLCRALTEPRFIAGWIASDTFQDSDSIKQRSKYQTSALVPTSTSLYCYRWRHRRTNEGEKVESIRLFYLIHYTRYTTIVNYAPGDKVQKEKTRKEERKEKKRDIKWE